MNFYSSRLKNELIVPFEKRKSSFSAVGMKHILQIRPKGGLHVESGSYLLYFSFFQDHYDFGMRAVKTVIAVAGNLKRERPMMNERQIVLRALRDVNVPKFLRDDLKLFNGIVSDLFPKMVEEVVDYGDLEEAIRLCTNKINHEDVDGKFPVFFFFEVFLFLFEIISKFEDILRPFTLTKAWKFSYSEKQALGVYCMQY